MDNIKEEIGRRLKKLREYLKLSPEEFYGALGLRAEYRHKYETGMVLPKIEKFAQLKKLYNVNLNWLIAGIGPMFETEELSENELSQEEKKIAEEIADFFSFQKEEREVITERELLNLYVFYTLSYLWKFKHVNEIKTIAEKLMLKSPGIREEILKDVESFNLPIALAISVIQFELYGTFYELSKNFIKKPTRKISYKFVKAIELVFTESEPYTAFVWDFYSNPAVVDIVPSRDVFVEFAQQVAEEKSIKDEDDRESVVNILKKQIIRVYEKYFDIVIPKIKILPELRLELDKRNERIYVKRAELKENIIKFPVIKKEKRLVSILKELEELKEDNS